jgi:hypothetical protein
VEEPPAAAAVVVAADPPEPKPLYTVPAAADPLASVPVEVAVMEVLVELTRVGSCAPQGWS